VRVEVLGPVRAEVDGEDRTPAGKRDRALVAMLALAGGGPVRADDVSAGLWGALVPPPGTLEALAERVGATLAPEGLTLSVAADDVDALRAESLAATADGQPAAEALATIEAALALWHGPVLSGVEDVPFARPHVDRLSELRLALVEERFERLLQLGRQTEVVEELREATREHPTRERLWGQLMTAYYREQRFQDAMEVYADARAVLADELGIEPGEALQRLEAAILLEDPGRDPALGDHPAPRASARLPIPRTPTVGRVELVERVDVALREASTLLVTLTGMGGTGKTRVATVAAAQVRDATDREVSFLEVTEGDSADDVVAAVSSVVGEAEADAASGRGPLVVLDNVDVSAQGAEAVRRLLEDLPTLELLVTCRFPLRLAGEQVVSVDPLAVPAPDASAAEVRENPSVELFSRLAQQADPQLDLTGRERELAEVCRLLDGVPLALELAAARVRLVGIDGLRASLETGLELLRTTAPDVPERQRALASTIAWSFDRLDEGAQRLCRRLAVFEQAFTLEAAEAVAADIGEVIDGLTQVMDAGLVRTLVSRVRIGFVMPATVHAYLRSNMPDPRELDPARLALAAYLLDHVHGWHLDLDRGEGRLALGRFQDVGRDVHASIDALLRLGRIEDAAALTLASGPFWIAGGELRGGLARTRTVLRAVPGSSLEAGRLHALAGTLAYHLNEDEEAVADLLRAVAIAEPLGDEATVATSRCFHGAALLITDDVERGTELARLGAEAAGRLGLYPLVAEGLGVLAMAHAIAGDFDREREMRLARLAVAREHGDIARTADALSTLAEIALDEADAGTARAYAEEALAIAHPVLPMEARDALVVLARAAVAEGDLESGARTVTDALEAAEKIGQTFAIGQCFRVAGSIAAARGRAAEAVRLYAAAQRLAPSPNGTDDPVEGDLAGGLDLARSTLGAEAAVREWTLGTSLPVERLRELLVAVVGAAVA
jgi:predicted ATPase/DNA-binding SARP family transcriptional activator